LRAPRTAAVDGFVFIRDLVQERERSVLREPKPVVEIFEADQRLVEPCALRGEEVAMEGDCRRAGDYCLALKLRRKK